MSSPVRHRRNALCALGLSAIFAGVACAEWFDLAGTRCDEDGSCGPGLVCQQGFCVPDDAGLGAPDAQVWALDAAAAPSDAGEARDSGAAWDAGGVRDGGVPRDAGVPTDAGACPAVTSISAGGLQHTCAVMGSAAWCWGNNQVFKVVANGGGDTVVPVPVGDPLPSGVRTISAGGYHSCAATQGAWCWGQDGLLGSTAAGSKVPVAVELSGSVESISSGTSHSCAVVDGAAWCWGANGHGESGDSTAAQNVLLPKRVGNVTGVLAISAGGRHTCAVSAGEAWCWGDDYNGQLGDGRGGGSVMTPTPVRVLMGSVTAISAGGRHTCAVKDGGAWCWGDNSYGQLGNGTTTQANVPALVPGLDRGVKAISAGGRHTCAAVDTAIKCWGNNASGQLGTGDAQPSLVPVEVPGLAGTVLVVSAGGDHYYGEGHTCAVVDGTAWCWGSNGRGELGIGTQAPSSVPVPVKFPCSQ